MIPKGNSAKKEALERETPTEVAQPDEADGTRNPAVLSRRHPPVPQLTGDGFDPIDSFPKMARFLPPATEDFVYSVREARSQVFKYIQGADLTEFARKERPYYASLRPSVMFSHLMGLIMEKELVDTGLGKTLDRVFGTPALHHARQEIQNVQAQCSWDLICLASVFMFRTQVIPRSDI